MLMLRCEHARFRLRFRPRRRRLLALSASARADGRRAPAPLVGARAETVVFFLPGRKDRASIFVDKGMFDIVREKHFPADLIGADAHAGYYERGAFERRFEVDLVEPARKHGYAHMIIVGVSWAATARCATRCAIPAASRRWCCSRRSSVPARRCRSWPTPTIPTSRARGSGCGAIAASRVGGRRLSAHRARLRGGGFTAAQRRRAQEAAAARRCGDDSYRRARVECLASCSASCSINT